MAIHFGPPPPAAKRPPAPMVKLDRAKTVRARNMRSGRLEIWEAASDDGIWEMRRLEDEGTTWELCHAPTGRYLGSLGSLKKARVAAASSWIMALLDRREAEEKAAKIEPVLGVDSAA